MLFTVARALNRAGIEFLETETFRLTDEILTHLLKFTLLFQVTLAQLNLGLADEDAAGSDDDLLWMACAEAVVALWLLGSGLWRWAGESDAELDHAALFADIFQAFVGFGVAAILLAV